MNDMKWLWSHVGTLEEAMRLTPLGHPEGCPYRASFVGTRLAVSANRVNYFVGMALYTASGWPIRLCPMNSWINFAKCII